MRVVVVVVVVDAPIYNYMSVRDAVAREPLQPNCGCGSDHAVFGQVLLLMSQRKIGCFGKKFGWEFKKGNVLRFCTWHAPLRLLCMRAYTVVWTVIHRRPDSSDGANANCKMC
jgi:hypothetical protein